MVTILKGKASLQIKFGLSYILIIVVVLVILNTYPLLASENLVFRTKETSVSASVKMVESASRGSTGSRRRACVRRLTVWRRRAFRAFS